eukprot:CAMPEP_0194144832 /NCGR_PEP_ID=MMETSP0152-20130528/13837_1 /TAXON_ID=1049557 /ORGANISM="Thalassiothrix antarctica, Strain L6-D1" /LENGTH=360 /DNA_ID=CAMNT_0038844843 /DNA_START=135 /DNA_END=1217 /DNA_ORIENTATION=+
MIKRLLLALQIMLATISEAWVPSRLYSRPMSRRALNDHELQEKSTRIGNKLFVAGIKKMPTNEAKTSLENFFCRLGLDVTSVEVFSDGRDYGFVTLRTPDDAIIALKHGNQSTRRNDSVASSLLFTELKPATLLAPRPKARTLRSKELFGTRNTSKETRKFESGVRALSAASSNDEIPPTTSIIADGIKSPENLGSMYRLMASFGARDLMHVYADGAVAPEWTDPPRQRKIEALSVGCTRHVERSLQPRSHLIEHLARHDRRPVVAIETASNAVSLSTFHFPQACEILVGAEGRGLDPKVAKALRPGFDHFVVIPMTGPHFSLNVATALGIALYEYRRQWPSSVEEAPAAVPSSTPGDNS